MKHVKNTQNHVVEEHVEEGNDQQSAGQKPTTGIIHLDQLIEDSSVVSQAMALVCIELTLSNESLGDRLREFLELKVGSMRQGDFPNNLNAECECLPISEWFNFLNGYQSAKGESDENKSQ